MKTLQIISTTILLMFYSINAFSALITATTAGAWSTPGTWDLGRVPADGDNVVISVDVTFAGSFSIGSPGYNYTGLTVDATRLFAISTDFIVAVDMDGDIITNNGTMTVGGDMTLNNKLQVDNNGTFNVTGSYFMNAGSTEFNNGAGATMTVGTTFTNDQALFTNAATGNVNITGSLTLQNLGVTTNTGTITCAGFIMNNGNVTNNAGGLIDIGSTGSLINGSVINNAGTMDFDQLLTIDGLTVGNTGGTVNARGGLTLNNNACFTGGNVNYWGTLTNPGTCTFAGVILPVEVVKFYGEQIGDNVELSWLTASEKNCAYFNVEHSLDGFGFSKIGELSGSGTTSDMTDYTFMHVAPKEGVNYYRFLQVDNDGTATYGDIISVYVAKEANLLQHPIVKRGEILEIDGVSETDNVVLSSTLGAMYDVKLESTVLKVDTGSLISGLYFLAIDHDGYVQKISFAVYE